MSEIFKGIIVSLASFLSLNTLGFLTVTKRNRKAISMIAFYIIFCCMYLLIYFYFTGILKTITLFMLFTIDLYYLWKHIFSKAILGTIIYMILLVIPDMMTMFFSIYVFNVKKEYYYGVFANSIIGNIIVNLLMILIVFLLRKPLKKIINNKISSNKKIVLMSFLTFVSIAIFFYKLISKFEFSNDIIGNIIVMITLSSVLFVLFREKIENNRTLKKYDELLDIMKNYENDIEEQRTLIHETRNELSTIRCKIIDKEREKDIIEYIDSILGDKMTSSTSKYSKLKYLPSNGLRGFFYYKVSDAERKGISVSINISSRIEKSYLKDMETRDFKDLARIIGVYMDNAIEASIESINKKLGIEIYKINKNIKIIISNSYNNLKIGKEGLSTKGIGRGHGLLLVKKILNESKIISSNSKITDNLYVQEILIKNKDQN